MTEVLILFAAVVITGSIVSAALIMTSPTYFDRK
jgi:hypothetical protein